MARYADAPELAGDPRAQCGSASPALVRRGPGFMFARHAACLNNPRASLVSDRSPRTRRGNDPAMAPLLGDRRLMLLATPMAVLGPVSLSFYVPAMPTMVVDLGTTASFIKLSLTLYLLGFAVAQLICGPLSDRFGRRIILLLFSLIYVAGSLLVFVTPSVEGVLAGRVIQGIGGCAGMAISRAMVRDCLDGQAAARVHSIIAMALSVAPAIGPVLGSLLLEAVGWRALFLVMASYGLGLCLLVLLAMPETNRHPDPGALRFWPMVANYGRLLRSPAYMRLVLVMAVALGGLYTFGAVTPFVYIGIIGLSPQAFALVMTLGAVSFFAGSSTANRLMRKMPSSDLVVIGLGALCAGAVTLFVGLLVLTPSVASVVLPTMVWTFGAALVLPGATMGALSPFPGIAGSAAALMGFLQMTAGVLGSGAASLFADSAVGLALVPLAMALVALLAFLLLRPRAGSLM
jgi:MFS transporter, DHA1 family, multidrug resistance protein